MRLGAMVGGSTRTKHRAIASMVRTWRSLARAAGTFGMRPAPTASPLQTFLTPKRNLAMFDISDREDLTAETEKMLEDAAAIVKAAGFNPHSNPSLVAAVFKG